MTAGLVGSSVVTGLLARAGLWTGHETHRKRDYDTFENARLIELNRSLFDAVNFDGRYETSFPEWVVGAIEQKSATIDAAPYIEFIADCNRHSPWIWKDPRLSMTVRAWCRWLDLDTVQFVMVRREFMQSWISNLRRRCIESFAFHRAYNEQVRGSIEEFFASRNRSFLDLVYEDLILKPEDSLERINQFFGTELDMDDLTAVFSGRLYARQHGAKSMAAALAIYFKNYRQRRTLA